MAGVNVKVKELKPEQVYGILLELVTRMFVEMYSEDELLEIWKKQGLPENAIEVRDKHDRPH